MFNILKIVPPTLLMDYKHIAKILDFCFMTILLSVKKLGNI